MWRDQPGEIEVDVGAPLVQELTHSRARGVEGKVRHGQQLPSSRESHLPMLLQSTLKGSACLRKEGDESLQLGMERNETVRLPDSSSKYHRKVLLGFRGP